MELTVDQALQRGIAAYKEGKLLDAERFFRAVLQAQPNHPDANHNLGVLAVAIGKPLEAIPFFKLALEASPKIEQFWSSYIDVLIRLERFDEAKRLLVQGEKSGVSAEKLELLHQQIRTSPPRDKKNTKQGRTVPEKRERLAEKKDNKKRKAQAKSSNVEPSLDKCNHLLRHYQAGRFEDAEALAKSITQDFPKHPFGWKALGAVLLQTGRFGESVAPMQSAVKLSPQDAEAHYNLGNTLQALGRSDEAEESYRHAIALKPDYSEAYNNLGGTLKALGRLDEAEESCRHAIALKPDYSKAHNNLGNTLQKLGRLDGAEASLRKAIALKPDYAEAHNNLGVALQGLGKLDEAEESYRQAITLKPDFAEAHRNLATTVKFSSEDRQLSQMQALYRDSAISGSDRCHICFALAKASDSLEDWSAAFKFYAEGNALRKKQLGYDKAQDQKLFEELKANYPCMIAHSLQPEIHVLEHVPIL